MPAMSEPFHPIEQPSLGDRVASEVLRRIASGDLGPGDRLPSERRLAELLAVSRVSVRAGLQQLKAQGLLTVVRGGGARVAAPETIGDPALTALAQLDRTSLLDLLEIRTLLECWAAERAASRTTAADITELRGHIARMADPDDNKAQADIDFHLAIARICDSPIYRHMVGVIHGTLSEMVRFHRFELFGGPEDDQAVHDQHSAIADALEQRDRAAARDAMARHLAWVRSRYETLNLAAHKDLG